MIANGSVPVGCPVDQDGRVTGEWDAMVGLAGRGDPNRRRWGEGEDFPLITDKDCLAVLTLPMDLNIGGTKYRLASNENYYVTVRRGKIIDFDARARNQ